MQLLLRLSTMEHARYAEQVEAVRQSNRGVQYFQGNGVPQDKAKGARLFRQAAEQGLAIAQCNLGA
jgi:TPR repeat protein